MLSFNHSQSHKEKAVDNTKNSKQTVASFIRESPDTVYTFDTPERDANEAELCRSTPGGGQKCIKVALASKKLFATMQDLGFYCALPMDPSRTYMECKPLPK
ncbi:hypothetical protein BOTBODRAFT_62522 [Botryobasidium botryosum FD-172 SS1]|uniref:Uncharacterized protein n=1 Tax=Botryobasidium botryosum (strain FD-172 SS1) TaxID=930990 RepID=A0A067MZR4_BOTB1|nr:hypothetical protein BOTBODRAFT_62522 [Botryobasidium botryosum FD-172 SS1]